MSLLKLEKIEESLARYEDFTIDQETIMSIYEGHTIFSLFIDKAEIFQQIMDQF